ncbi:uncharacterized protein LOC110613253 isoform X2 [Manihot esculenta]|uniref:Uncharacterized protein n=1 Tax=Manihot esculenta TaxID=3983 RepID=A0A2C9W2V1_MANES|nr:uncharacterized protein LOC110613253 isoform X2 [Manihot esculenta]OAY53318.1 hypothetical protein MANES_04G154000v8 [Manihot esculenta]
MSSFLISRRLSSKLLKLSPSSLVYSHFISQETQIHGFTFCPQSHSSISPFSHQQNPFNQNTLSKSRLFSAFIGERAQIPDVKNKEMTPQRAAKMSSFFISPRLSSKLQQNPSTQNKHGFTLSKMETSRYFSTFIRERTQIPDVKNKEMTSTKPLSSSIYTHITNQKPRYLSSSSDPEKSQNDPSKLPSFKHQETEKRDESSEALARCVMKKIFSGTKILFHMVQLHIGLHALIFYMAEGTIPILEVSLLSGILLSFIQLDKLLQFEILSREGQIEKLWLAKFLLFLLQLTLVMLGIVLVFKVVVLMALLGMDV